MNKHCCKRGEPRKFLESLLGHQGVECIRWPFKFNAEGYGYAYRDSRYLSASRFMCILTHGEPVGDKNQAAHSCGNRWCVNPAHLSWKTKAGNSADRYKHGTMDFGERQARAKISDAEARAILASTDPVAVIAARYGINGRTVYDIKQGARWAHLRWSNEQEQAA